MALGEVQEKLPLQEEKAKRKPKVLSLFVQEILSVSLRSALKSVQEK